jgi:hypothetical protein
LLRLQFVTGTPDVLSLAPNLPTPCGYTLFSALHLEYLRGTRSPALGELTSANLTAPELAGASAAHRDAASLVIWVAKDPTEG